METGKHKGAMLIQRHSRWFSDSVLAALRRARDALGRMPPEIRQAATYSSRIVQHLADAMFSVQLRQWLARRLRAALGCGTCWGEIELCWVRVRAS